MRRTMRTTKTAEKVRAVDVYNKEVANSSGEYNVEFEMRLHGLDKNGFIAVNDRLSKRYKVQPELTTTINIIRNERGYNKIIEIVFVGGVKKETRYVEKRRIASERDGIGAGVGANAGAGVGISVSTERTIGNVTAGDDDIVRFKARLSYIVAIPTPLNDGVSKWRYDLTAVRSAKFGDIKNSLSVIRDKLFVAKLTSNNFIDTFDFDEADSFEMEVERLESQPNLTNEIVAKVNEEMMLINDPEFIERKKYKNYIYEVAKYVVPEKAHMFKHNLGMKALGSQVYSITKNDYYSGIFPPVGYYVTDKTDGVRCIIYIVAANDDDGGNENGEYVILTGSGIAASNVSNNKGGEVTIVEGEIVGTDIYLFECLVHRDENVSQSGFSARLVAMTDSLPLVNRVVSPSGFKITTKKFTKITSAGNLKEPIETTLNAEYPYEIDGIVFVEDGTNYTTTKNYKWKPAELNTIDFLALKASPTLLGTEPYIERDGYNIYILFVGISADMFAKLGLKKIQGYDEMLEKAKIVINSDSNSRRGNSYFPIQYCSSSNPLAYIYHHKKKLGDINGNIVELRYIPSSNDGDDASDRGIGKGKGNWEFLRLRNDRTAETGYYGNDFRVAEFTFSNYIDPFPAEALWNKSAAYFTRVASTTYFAQNKYKRYVIDKVFNASFGGMKVVVDLAAGRGADIHRYQAIGVKSLLCMDIDSTAIAELIRRRFEFVASRNAARTNTKISPMNIMTMVADLKSPKEELMEKVTNTFHIAGGMVSGVVCNFAIHYMCDTLDHIRNLLLFIHGMLEPGGLFMFTTMNGAKIFELLERNDGNWSVNVNDGAENGAPIKKFALTKKYKGTTLSAAGQNIEVLLPLSDEMKEEPLANIDTIISVAEKIGFLAEINISFADDIGAFAIDVPQLHSRLSEDDKHYIGLHQLVTLRKKK